MINEGKFGVHEAVWMTAITIGAKLYYTSPAWLTNFVGTAGWQMTIISCLTATIAFLFVVALLKRFPGKGLIEIFDISLGRVIGLFLALLFAASLLIESSVFLREFAEVMKVYVYTETPLELIIGIFIAAVVTISLLGLETIARVAKLSAYALVFSHISLLILSIQNYNWTNLFPILGYGLDKTVIHGLRRSSAYQEIMVLAVFATSLQGIDHIRKAGFISLALSGFFIANGLFFMTLAFPVHTLQELVSPMFILARNIEYGVFFQRLESIFLFVWIFISLISVSVLFYCSASCYCKAFRLQDQGPLILPLAAIMYAAAFVSPDFPGIIQGDVQTIRDYGWAVFYAVPLITLIAAVLRKKRGKA